MPFNKYGLSWPDSTDTLQVEMYMIRKDGKWTENGVKFGQGKSFHYEQMRLLIWPHLDSHRWHNLCRDEILRDNATVTVLMGPGSSGKTHEAAWIFLCEYFCFPNETCVLVSSTDIRGLKLRVWGEMTMLWEAAVQKYSYLPGHLLDSKLAIVTDELDDGDFEDRSSRDLRRGVIAIPTVQGGKNVGLQKWVGIKQKRVRLVADEASMMSSTFLSAFSNLNKNISFESIVLGNPMDIMDPLGKCAEPADGWSEEYLEPTKTTCWDTRFMNGRCVNLIGTDSPNMDFPQDQPARYKYLISAKKIAETLSFFQKDSLEYYSQCVGSMKVGTMARRIITRAKCEKFKSMEPVIWEGKEALTRVAGLDSAYGGDRCVLTRGEFGKDKDGKYIVNIYAPVIVPISVKSDDIPEDQISKYCRDYCVQNDVLPENFFHDSTGRGTLGTSLARIWSSECNPVEFGGSASERPVSLDLFVDDPITGTRRLKTCYEHFDNFVSELWFSVAYTIESEQLRGLVQEVMEEGCLRTWDWVRGEKKLRIETKVEMKARVGRSPDLFDSLAIVVEGCRRRGFVIAKVGSDTIKHSQATNRITKFHEKYQAMLHTRQLQKV